MDIVAIIQSPHTAVYKLFKEARTGINYSSKNSLTSSLRTSVTGGTIAKSPRPAIVQVYSPRDVGGSPGTAAGASLAVYLMATYNHTTAFDHFPEVLQRFAIPVSPHWYCDGHVHIHTTPEWQINDQWLLAFLFDASASDSGRWNFKVDGKRNKEYSFVIDPDTMALIDDLRLEALEKWMEKCQGKGGKKFLKECEAEYKVSTRDGIIPIALESDCELLLRCRNSANSLKTNQCNRQ